MQSLVLCELEKMKVCHTSQYECQVFPWLKPCLEKLVEKKLNKEDKVKVLAFVTRVALLMNGLYVDYLNFSRLERQLPVTQTMLRMLEIQCKFQISNINTLKLYRLHSSIPYKLYQKVKATASSDASEKPENEERQYIRDEDEMGSMQTTDTIENTTQSVPLPVTANRHVPNGGKYTLWTSKELTIVKQVMEEVNTSVEGRYKLYIEKCVKEGIASRSIKAFMRKCHRMMLSERQ